MVSENETLTDKARYGVTADSSETESVDTVVKVKTSKFSVTSGPNILFESRISELEAILAQTNIDFQRLNDENEELKRKFTYGGLADSGCSEAYKKQIENLQRDKNNLEDTVKKLQKSVTALKETDAQCFSKTQRNREEVERSHFERTQADIEIRRLKVRNSFDLFDFTLNICNFTESIDTRMS